MKITFFRSLGLVLALLPLSIGAAEPAKGTFRRWSEDRSPNQLQQADKAAAVEAASQGRGSYGPELVPFKPFDPPTPIQPWHLGSAGSPQEDKQTLDQNKTGRPSARPKDRGSWPSTGDMTPVNKRGDYDQPATPAVLTEHREKTVADKTVNMADNTARVEQWGDGPPPTPWGHFQVILLGFEVNRQTRDDALENDGRGDEVFLHSAVHHRYFDRVTEGFQHTAIMGDQNRHWLRAGTAGAEGGLRSGDNVGTRRLPTDFSREGFRSFRLPMLAFDGQLMEGRDSLLVSPSVWEWDDWGHAPGTGSELRFGDFHSDASHEENRAARYQAAFRTTHRQDRLRRLLGDVLDDRAADTSPPRIFSGRGVYPGAVDDMGGNRPLGMTRVEDLWGWTPQVLALNYTTADHISRTEFEGARGVVTIRYADADELCGDYTLYLQVRRVE